MLGCDFVRRAKPSLPGLEVSGANHCVEDRD